MKGPIVSFIALLAVLQINLSFVEGKSIVPPNQKGNAVTPRTYTCQCGEDTSPLCGNNGVTYKNMCRFECAKHGEERLRVLKEGPCGEYTSKVQFWKFGG